MDIEIKELEQKQIDILLMKYKFAERMLTTEIDILIQEFSHRSGYNPVEHVKARMKSEESIRHKLAKKGQAYTALNILKYVDDVVGIRIVCSFLTDVYDIVSMIVSSKNILVKERKDYITNPKETGYTSYHLIVLVPVYLQEGVEYMECEIQIRTIAMDFWASLDHKISYKFPKEIPEEVKKEMYDYSLIIKQLDKKMLEVNEIMNQYKEE